MNTAPSLIFVNGNVIPMTGQAPARAVAVTQDRITAVGTDREIQAMAHGSTRVIDLKGRTLLPGFIDTHVHLLGYGASFSAVDLLQVRSREKLVRACRDHIRKRRIPKGQWLFGRGFNQATFTDSKEFPTAHTLDAISPDHPILLLRTCGHIGVVNAAALKLARVTPDTHIRGGCFDKDAAGAPNGVIREAALEWFKKQIADSRSTQGLKRDIRAGGEALARWGITSVHSEDSYDLGYGGDLSHIHRAYKDLTQGGQMPLRVYQKVSLPRKRDLEAFLDKGLTTGMGDDFFRMGPMKLWADGTMGARTAALRAPYADSPGETGILLYRDQELADMIQTAQDHDLQACIHAIGDQALEQVVRSYEKVMEKGGLHQRHRIVHCQIGSPDLYRRIGRLGLSVNIQPLQTATDFPLIENRLGRERASACHAWQTCLDAGIILTGSSDVPCTFDPDAANVFHGIHAIVNRDQWLPHERVSVWEALKMYTVNAAWSASEERIKGTIEPGKLADLVVVNEDPLKVDRKGLKDIRVEITLLGGETVFQSGD